MPIITSSPSAAGIILVPGLEAYHTWNGSVVLNDRAAWPRYRLKRISGLRSLADPEDRRDKNFARAGEVARSSVRRGKTVTYEGVIEGRSLIEMELADANLRGAFDSMEEGQMTITTDPAYAPSVPSGASLVTLFFNARALSLEIAEEQTAAPFGENHGHERPFALALRLADPRLYLPQVGPANTPALAGGPPASATVTVTNVGDSGTDRVTVDITGPITDPLLANDTLGKVIDTIAGYAIPAGHFLRLDFRDRSAMYDATTDHGDKIDLLNTDWWDRDTPGLAPGANTIRLQGTGTTSATDAAVSHYPATR